MVYFLLKGMCCSKNIIDILHKILGLKFSELFNGNPPFIRPMVLEVKMFRKCVLIKPKFVDYFLTTLLIVTFHKRARALVCSFFLILLLVLLPLSSFAEHSCSGPNGSRICSTDDCTQSDVAAAIDDVESNGGGIVNIGSGDCVWSGSTINIVLTGSIEIIGAGVGNTILRIPSGVSRYFSVDNSSAGAANFVRFSGMSLIPQPRTKYTEMIYITKAQNFRVDHIYTEAPFGQVIITKNVSKGLIDNNQFVQNATTACGSAASYGYQAGQSFTPYPTPETKDCHGKVCDCAVGSRSVARDSSIASGKTVIARLDGSSDASANINNDGGAGSGTVQRIYVYINSVDASPTIDVASFSASGNTMTTNGIAEGVTVHEGLNVLVAGEDFTAFDIEDGEYIGVYLKNCTLASAKATLGSDGGATSSAHWIESGDQIPASSVDFDSPVTNNVSIWADINDDEGDIDRCLSDWDDWWTNNTTARGGGAIARTMDQSWKPTSNDDVAIFVEDNYIQWVQSWYEGNWASLQKAVIRHNQFMSPPPGTCDDLRSQVTNKPGAVFTMLHDNVFNYYSFTRNDISFNSSEKTINMVGDVNGYTDFLDMFSLNDQIDISGSADNDGTVTVSAITKNQITVSESLTNEAAGNTITLNLNGVSQKGYAVYLYMSNGLIYNNTFNNHKAIFTMWGTRYYSSTTFPPMVRQQNLHIWNNTGNNVNCGDPNTLDCLNQLQSGEFNGFNGWNGTFFYRAPLIGERLYNFTEYPYPHPLASGKSKIGEKPASPANLRIFGQLMN